MGIFSIFRPSPAKRFQQLKEVALSRTLEAEAAVNLIGQILTGEERTRVLIDIVNNGQNVGPRAAIEQLGRPPITEPAIDALCRIIESMDMRDSVMLSSSKPCRAADAIYHLLGADRWRNSKFVAALLKVTCEGEWSRDYASLAGTMFHNLELADRSVLDNVVIPELQRRVMAAPLTNTYFGAKPDAEQALYFLNELRKRHADRVKLAIEEIDADTLRRCAQALPVVTKLALTGARYEEVESATKTLHELAGKGVPGAAEALLAFKQAPARALPKKMTEPVEYWDAGERFTEYKSYDELVSTADLGQRLT